MCRGINDKSRTFVNFRSTIGLIGHVLSIYYALKTINGGSGAIYIEVNKRVNKASVGTGEISRRGKVSSL